MHFSKWQGLGNDFVLIDMLGGRTKLTARQIRRLCDRRFGIGADQLLQVLPSRKADFRMRVFNADGGEVEMCGNGIRCFARYLVSRKLTGKKRFEVETAAGIIKPHVEGERVTVDMGRPSLEARAVPVMLEGEVINRQVRCGGAKRRITCVSMGNPHCVIFVGNLENCPVEKIGPVIEHDPLFPRRINVEFVKVESRTRIAMRVWERGAGETLACGTGACAAAVASILNGKTGRAVTVRLKGGALAIRWPADGNVFMSGPAVEVFKGEIAI
jgi:diaminopimelate epimerase